MMLPASRSVPNPVLNAVPSVGHSNAVRMLLVRVAAEKALPFDVKVPNATTAKAMRAADKGKGRRLASARALFKDWESDPVSRSLG
jgi:hypothetical protein